MGRDFAQNWNNNVLARVRTFSPGPFHYSGLRPSKAVRCHVKNTSKFDPWLICFINGDASNELLLGPAALEGHSAKRFLIENRNKKIKLSCMRWKKPYVHLLLYPKWNSAIWLAYSHATFPSVARLNKRSIIFSFLAESFIELLYLCLSWSVENQPPRRWEGKAAAVTVPHIFPLKTVFLGPNYIKSNW